MRFVCKAGSPKLIVMLIKSNKEKTEVLMRYERIHKLGGIEFTHPHTSNIQYTSGSGKWSNPCSKYNFLSHNCTILSVNTCSQHFRKRPHCTSRLGAALEVLLSVSLLVLTTSTSSF